MRSYAQSVLSDHFAEAVPASRSALLFLTDFLLSKGKESHLLSKVPLPLFFRKRGRISLLGLCESSSKLVLQEAIARIATKRRILRYCPLITLARSTQGGNTECHHVSRILSPSHLFVSMFSGLGI